MVPVSLKYPFVIVPLVFYNVYVELIIHVTNDMSLINCASLLHYLFKLGSKLEILITSEVAEKMVIIQ